MSELKDVDLKDIAYAAVDAPGGKFRLAICKRDERGYRPVREDCDAGGTFPTYEKASDLANLYNVRLGHTDLEAAQIISSTM